MTINWPKGKKLPCEDHNWDGWKRVQNEHRGIVYKNSCSTCPAVRTLSEREYQLYVKRNRA